jgi:class 3 adenylate cyclase/ADP-ribose pyrophosphatase YjhB (NUDIX family)
MTTTTLARQPTMVTDDGQREFACFPAAILGFVVNDDDEILLLSHPARKGGWEVINGAMREGESPVVALLREVSEEAGSGLTIRPVGLVHTFLYRFDSAIPAMLSIAYVATYVDGDVVPGSDMAMSEFRWASLHEIESAQLSLAVPSQSWLFRRALTVHALFKGEQVELEPWQAAAPRRVGVDRALAAVLFTDIVNSTSTNVSIGDIPWLNLLKDHDRIALRVVSRHGGRIVKHMGDGLLALFASVGDAVDAAKSIQEQAEAIGVAVRAGVHVGEIEVLAADVFGQAVVMASRICAAASAGELLVSQTAANLLAGSQVHVEGPKAIEMKGLGEVVVFAARTP